MGPPAGTSGACSAVFPAGTRVKLDARAAAGSKFVGWAPRTISGCQNGDPTVVAGTVHSCQPVFEPEQPSSFLLQATQVGSGRITSSPAGIDCTFDSDAGVLSGSCAATFPRDTVVTLTATALAGWSFSSWSGDDADCNDGVVRMSAARRCTATFVRGTPTFALAITKRGEGTVTASPAGINCGTDCSEAYASGTVVTLTATPATGWTFDRWRGDADCTDGIVTMNAARTCTAEFKD